MALIKKKDEHIERLLSRAYYWYFPVRDDPIDCALAHFINSSENPPLVAFVRESKGFYSFGKRKVELRLERDHLIGKCGHKCSSYWRWIHDNNWIRGGVHSDRDRERRRRNKARGELALPSSLPTYSESVIINKRNERIDPSPHPHL